MEPADDGPLASDDARRDVTIILDELRAGEAEAWSRLVPLVYDELHRIARGRLAGLRPGNTLGATALVHEAYIKLLAAEAPSWENRRHFFAAAARAMRNILVDELRRRQRHKRGGDWQRITLDDHLAVGKTSAPVDLLALDEILERLEAVDAQQHEIVMLRYFAGLSIDEVAAALNVSSSTVDRQWSFARAWLHRELSGRENGEPQ